MPTGVYERKNRYKEEKEVEENEKENLVLEVARQEGEIKALTSVISDLLDRLEKLFPYGKAK